MTQEIVRFITGRYAAAYQSTAPVTYHSFLSVLNAGRGAALGFRRAAEGPLFLEKYLDRPVEQALEPHLGQGVSRSRIVEIGSLAASNGLAMVSVWAQAARSLGEQADIGVAVLTAPLRAMFARLQIPVHVLAPAHAACIGPSSALWGSYYANDPVVCAGSLHAGFERLERFMARRRSLVPAT